MAVQYVPISDYVCSRADSDYLAPADFVLSKVTPTLVTDLGYKIFLMFATINIGGMATFALYVLVLYILLLYCIAGAFVDCMAAALSRRRRAAAWRRWTSSSAPSRPTNGKPTLRSRSAVRCACIDPQSADAHPCFAFSSVRPRGERDAVGAVDREQGLICVVSGCSRTARALHRRCLSPALRSTILAIFTYCRRAMNPPRFCLILLPGSCTIT